jgi:glutamine cyclotransferase
MRNNSFQAARNRALCWLAAAAMLALAGCQPEAQAGPPTGVPSGASAVISPAAATQPPLPTSTVVLSPTATVAVAAVASATPAPVEASPAAPPAATEVVTGTSNYRYRVVNVFPHDPAAFTQGLVYQDGLFYEGTGQRGQSTLRQVDPATGQVLQGVRLPDPYFGEGIAIVGDRLYQLTWQENTGFVYDKDSFELLNTWAYAGEGWGLATDGQRLIMSDGSHVLRFLDPATLQEVGQIAVLDGAGQPVVRLNELEWVEGEIFANVWQTDQIARIDPASGRLLGWIDLAGLLPEEDRAAQRVDVLNGIAYDAATGRLFVTGKWWPKLFEIELIPEAQQ